MSKYVIGVDYGTLSGRAVIADAKQAKKRQVQFMSILML